MSRILFIIVLLVVGYLLLQSWQRKKTVNQNRPPRPITNDKHMVRCAKCGLYVPEEQAVGYEGKHFCSLEHAQLTRSGQDS